MIVFELICQERHRFEGWFASAGEFESQKSEGLLSCPVCGDSSIEKLLTAKIGRPEAETRESPTPPAVPEPVQPRNLNELIEYVLLNTEDVGNEFPSEARRIHYEEIPRRSIRGVASSQETRELLEEGIAVLPVPVPPRRDWH